MKSVLILLSSCALISAQTPSTEDALRKTIDDYVQAFNAKDAPRFLALQTDDEDNRDPRDGTFMPKRTLADLKEGFALNPNLKWTRHIDRIRMITPDVAIVDSTGSDIRPKANGETNNVDRFVTYVLKRVDGKWRVAAVRQSLK